MPSGNEISIFDIERMAAAERQSEFSKYIPALIAFGGVLVVAVIYKRKKRRGK